MRHTSEMTNHPAFRKDMIKSRLTFLIFSVCLFAFPFFNKTESFPGVYISEVCPHNQTVICDRVGEYSNVIKFSKSIGCEKYS